MRVYLDSCILIYLHEGSADLRGQIKARLESGVVACVSELSRLASLVAW